MYHDRGDGTFEDATKAAGLEGIDPKRSMMWSIAAARFDYDNDGSLDLFLFCRPAAKSHSRRSKLSSST